MPKLIGLQLQSPLMFSEPGRLPTNGRRTRKLCVSLAMSLTHTFPKHDLLITAERTVQPPSPKRNYPQQ